MGIIKKLLFNDGTNGGRIAAIPLWRSVIHDLLSHGASEEGIVRDHNIYATGNTFYSKQNLITYAYTFDGYPEELDINCRKTIRGLVSGTTKVAFISTLENEYINFESAAMKSKLSAWKRVSEDISSEDQNAFNYNDNAGKIKTTTHRSKSIVYMSDSVRQQKKFFTYRTMMLVTGERGNNFDNNVEEIEKYINNSLGITSNRVEAKITEFLRAFSPFTASMTDGIKKEIGKTVLTDELIARLSTYSQGRVGSGNFYMGTDVISGIPRMGQFRKNASDAENMIISAETGGGKSYFVKVLVLQFLGSDDYNITINDIEGDEYLTLAPLVSEKGDEVLVLNMGEGSGNYFDPAEIVIRGNLEEDEIHTLYTDSTSAISSILRTMVYRRGGENNWSGTIISEVITRAYRRRGVSANDPETYIRSKGMTLFDIYKELVHLHEIMYGHSEPENKDDSDKKAMYDNNSNYHDAFDYVYTQCSKYFSDHGERRNMFQKRVTMDQVANAKLVINSFGLRGKTPDQIDEIQLALSQIYAAHISHLRSLSSKEQGRYNVKLWEEFQRWGAIPGSKATLNTALTGGRKLGDVNIIVSNKLSSIVDDENNFGILENTQTFAIGAIGDSRVRTAFTQKKDVRNLLPELNMIYSETQNVLKQVNHEDDGNHSDLEQMVSSTTGGTGSRYERSFLVSTRGEQPTVVKMELPDSVRKSSLFETSVDTSKNKNKKSDKKSSEVVW